MNDEIIAEEGCTEAVEEKENTGSEESAEDIICGLRAENESLKRQLFFARRGIPKEAELFIEAAAEKLMAKDNSSFEEAADHAAEFFGRLRFSEAAERGVTGVKITDTPRDNDNALRRAFGLR